VSTLYLNVFVLVVQLFEKAPALIDGIELPQTELPMYGTQAAVLLVFAGLALIATMKFHVELDPAAWVRRETTAEP